MEVQDNKSDIKLETRTIFAHMVYGRYTLKEPMKLSYWYFAMMILAFSPYRLISMHKEIDFSGVDITILGNNEELLEVWDQCDHLQAYIQLSIAIANDNLDTVRRIISTHPDFISRAPGGYSVLTIAAKNHAVESMFFLIAKNPPLAWLEYQALAAELSKTPQTHASKSILAFLQLVRSAGYQYYHSSLKKSIDTKNPTEMIRQGLSRQVFQFGIPHIPYLSDMVSALATYLSGKKNMHEQLLYTAALDGNRAIIQTLLQGYHAHIRRPAYCRAASYGCYQDGNPYIALYILCHRILLDQQHPLFTFAPFVLDVFLDKARCY